MINIAFVYFRTLNLHHLDAAWYTLARQDFTDVGSVVFLDNNTLDAPQDIEAVLNRYPLPVPRVLCFEKHGLSNRTQSWSVNRAVDLCATLNRDLWVFFTRADFLLDDQCLTRFRSLRNSALARTSGWRGFVTSWCHQMGYDAALSNTDALARHSEPDAPWRTHPDSVRSLIGVEPANYFTTTGADAGVWLMSMDLFVDAGGLNERMVSWGYQQQAFQRALKRHHGEISVIEDYLYHHQHHWAPRDFVQAAKELEYE